MDTHGHEECGAAKAQRKERGSPNRSSFASRVTAERLRPTTCDTMAAAPRAALLCFVFFVFFCGHRILAADKSAVGPNSISLPKGPGSIEGLGESFQPSLNSGTASHRIPIAVPPGVIGFAPKVALSYEGGGGNGVLGYGWSLPLSYVQRRADRGIPTYGEDVGFPRDDTFINEMKEELVPVPDGNFFCKNEGAFIR